MIKPPIATIFILGFIAFAPLSAGAADRAGSVQNKAEREIARRQDNVNRAGKEIEQGDKAMKSRDYDVAVVQYKAACDLLPESPFTHDLRAKAVGRFSEASVKLAEQRIAEGRFADAEAAAKLVVDEHYNPAYRPALQLLSHLEDPGYYNKTVGPKFYGDVQEVKKLFTEADGFYDTGRYDLAYKRYEQILGIDPYNIAARKGEEKVNNARERYANQAYDTTRSNMNWQVTQKWEQQVKKYQAGGMSHIIGTPSVVKSTEAIQAKLARIIIPKIDFHDATVREAIDFLKQKSRELDTAEPDPTRRGVNIVLKLESTPGTATTPTPAVPTAPEVPGIAAPAAPAAAVAAASTIVPGDAKITLQLTNIPLSEALGYITKLSGLKVKVDPYAVTIVPISEITDNLLTKEYKVTPGFISTVSSAPGTSALDQGAVKAGGGAAVAPNSQPAVISRIKAQDFLAENGVQFPPGASANFLASSSKLIVRNTEANLDLVDAIVESMNSSAPVQVNIEAKFVEIQQQNQKELSFDWLLGQANIPGGHNVFFAGGNPTSSTAAGNFPFLNPTGAPVGTNPVTGGNRSGNIAIGANAIDALLLGSGGAAAVAPGIFSVAGVFTDPQFQVVIRALNQKKGVDLLSAPSVTTKSGQRATVDVIREFIYPTEFQPPQVPQAVNGGTPVITPTTPTSFSTRNTGVTLEVEPVVGPDGQTIDLNLVPQVVEFEGFINYGSPIFGLSINDTFNPFTGLEIFKSNSVLLTQNVINQPIFSSRKVTTSVTVWDGQTVVLGGLIREDVQKVEDKVPIVGDIPLLGRLFRSSVDQHLKRNLIIFVTAHLMNPAGELVHENEEKEEEVAPMTPPESLLPPPLPEMPLQK